MVTTPNMQKSISNDAWISPKDLNDPDPLPVPLGWRIIVRPIAVKEVTKGGILLPDAFKDDVQSLTTVGRVLAIGPLCFEGTDMGGIRWYDVGAYITFPKYAGVKFLYKGIRLLVLNDDEAIMRIDDPAALDPLYHLSN